MANETINTITVLGQNHILYDDPLKGTHPAYISEGDSGIIDILNSDNVRVAGVGSFWTLIFEPEKFVQWWDDNEVLKLPILDGDVVQTFKLINHEDIEISQGLKLDFTFKVKKKFINGNTILYYYTEASIEQDGIRFSGSNLNGIQMLDLEIYDTNINQLYVIPTAYIENDICKYITLYIMFKDKNGHWSSAGSPQWCLTLDSNLYSILSPSTNQFWETRKRENADTTETGGGYGTGVNITDTISIPDLPNFDLTSTGAFLYATTAEGLHSFVQWLWSDDYLTNIKQYYSSPSENIIGVGVIDLMLSGMNETVKVGTIDSGVNMERIKNWKQVDCGSIKVNEFYGTFADYEPYTNAILYLPKYGFVSVPCQYIMNNTISVKYNIDLMSGQGVAFVLIKNSRDGQEYVWNSFPVQCISKIALSDRDASNKVSAFMQGTKQTILNTTSSMMNANPLSANNLYNAGAAAVTGMMDTAMSTAIARNSTVTLSTFSEMSSFLNVTKPYLILQRTKMQYTDEYNNVYGHSTFLSKKVGEFSGYLQTKNAHVECINNDVRISEKINQLLDTGVFVK